MLNVHCGAKKDIRVEWHSTASKLLPLNLLRAMKITAALLLFACLQVSAEGNLLKMNNNMNGKM